MYGSWANLGRVAFARNCRDVDVEEAIKASLDLGVNEAQKTWKTNDPLTQLQSLKGTPQDPAIMIMYAILSTYLTVISILTVLTTGVSS